MSDNTLTVYEKCDHGRLEQHPLPGAIPVDVLGSAGMTFAKSDLCEGGREIVLRRDYEPVKVRWPCTDEGLSDEFWAVRVPHDGKWFVVEVER